MDIRRAQPQPGGIDDRAIHSGVLPEAPSANPRTADEETRESSDDCETSADTYPQPCRILPSVGSGRRWRAECPDRPQPDNFLATGACSVVLDRTMETLRRSGQNLQPTMIEPGRVKGRKCGEREDASIVHPLDLAQHAQTFRAQVDPARPIAKARAAPGMIDAPLRRVQRLRQAAKPARKALFARERPRPETRETPAATGDIAPVDLPHAQSALVPPTGHQVALGDRIIVQRPGPPRSCRPTGRFPEPAPARSGRGQAGRSPRQRPAAGHDRCAASDHPVRRTDQARATVVVVIPEPPRPECREPARPGTTRRTLRSGPCRSAPERRIRTRQRCPRPPPGPRQR